MRKSNYKKEDLVREMANNSMFPKTEPRKFTLKDKFLNWWNWLWYRESKQERFQRELLEKLDNINTNLSEIRYSLYSITRAIDSIPVPQIYNYISNPKPVEDDEFSE